MIAFRRLSSVVVEVSLRAETLKGHVATKTFAATLMYLKSRSLLPADQKTEEEIIDEEEQLRELKEKLAEYEKFKQLAAELGQRQNDPRKGEGRNE